ncbi:MAG TPA: aspartyl protease family protein, partial [Puia sp.]|nr:aspartyl protease family protein [Puia sp.]
MRLLLLSLLALIAGTLRPVAAQNEGLPADRYLTSVPFRILFGGVILGKARLDSFQDSLNFIFDTGCGSVSLDSLTAERLKLISHGSSAFIHGVAGICPQRLIDSQSLHLGGVTIDSLSMQVVDYDLLSSIYGEKIDGIIGYSFFSRYLVKVDYDSLKMDIYTRGPVVYPKGGFLLRPRMYGLPMLEG